MNEIETNHLKHLGSTDTTYDQQPGDPSVLETFNTPTSLNYSVTFSTNEFTSLCPKTGQPDFGVIEICFTPIKKCIESKSLKLYLFSFRSYQGFMEQITNKMADDIFNILNPRLLTVRGLFNARGGLDMTIVAERYGRPNLST